MPRKKAESKDTKDLRTLVKRVLLANDKFFSSLESSLILINEVREEIAKLKEKKAPKKGIVRLKHQEARLVDGLIGRIKGKSTKLFRLLSKEFKTLAEVVDLDRWEHPFGE